MGLGGLLEVYPNIDSSQSVSKPASQAMSIIQLSTTFTCGRVPRRQQ